MDHLKLMKAMCIVYAAMLTTNCATTFIDKNKGRDPVKSTIETQKKVFSDQIISYGLPSKPIRNHEYAIAMAGLEYSYLIEPSEKAQKSLFQDFFKHVDTRYLAFTTPKQQFSNVLQAKSIEQMSFEIKNHKIKQSLIFMLIKPADQLEENELKKMQQYQFDCEMKKNAFNHTEYLICKQLIPVELIVTSKANNTHQLTNQFRTPLSFDFYQVAEKTKINFKKLALTAFYPIAITYDIISLPVITGLAYIGIDGPADKAFEGFFKF